ncbi:hypothetical protein QWA_06575 [Alcaligenes faecalis subsp. faecalis NCIB 8687]|nr:hypothetical protein QWA_06575 [Alcaligenes faecalis subsp. faecalis NCIB 8687]
MSIIKTKRNHVAAFEPMDTDVAVIVRIGTAQAVYPIQQYRQAVQEAEAHADHMQQHVDVVPVNADELLALKGMTTEMLVADMTDDEREQLRKDCINACADAMRYSDDPALYPRAVATLRLLGVANSQQVH